MIIVPRIVRRWTAPKYYRKWFLDSRENFTRKPNRSFYSSANYNVKMFLEHENKHAFEIMETRGYITAWNIDKKTAITNDQFEQVMKEDWSKIQPKQLFEIFPLLGTYCTNNGLCISNKIFDDFIDTLTDNIVHASDKELESLFYAFVLFPETESIRTRNFIEVWAALDDACLNRLKAWSFDEMLHFISLFYMLNVTRASDFTTKCLNKLATKAKQLTTSQLVQTLFYVGIARRQPFDMHNLELQMIDKFEELSLDDIAIISMGFFKSKTPIRSMELISKIIERIRQNSNDLHEVSLAAILKIIRYSVKICTDDRIFRLLDKLQNEVPRLSIMCIVHLALLGTSTLTFHKDCLEKIASKTIHHLSDARLKDLERLLLTYGVFNYIPRNGTENYLQKMLEELRNPARADEIKKYGRSFASCVHYLGLLKLYPVDLMNKVLSPEFLENSYGKNCYFYGKEVLAIHNDSLIFCGEDKMNRLSDKVALVLAKKYTDYVPNEEYKKQYNITERMFLDVHNLLKESRGGSSFVIGDHILTHYQRGDIIVCNDQYGKPLPVTGVFSSNKFGFLRRPPDNNHWIVLVIAGRNCIINGTNTPVGSYQTKMTELQTLGYHPAMVLWPIYVTLKTKEEKLEYLNNLIKQSQTYTY